MFEQPPITDREVFGGGFVQGLACVFTGLIFSVPIAFWPSFKYGSPNFNSMRTEILLSWLLICTLFCAVSFSPKDEKRLATFRGGLITAYVLFLFLNAACWFVKF